MATKPKLKKISVSELVEDFSLYPRNKVNDTHVGELLRALNGGATFPPVVICAESKRIVDGVHRTRTYRRAFGDDAMIEAEFRTYENDAELFLDAVELNSRHGQRLDRHDQTRIVLKLRELKVDDQTISVHLHVPEQEVEKLAVRIVYGPDGDSVPLKRGLEHMRGQRFNSGQLEAASSVRSAEAGRLALELTRLLQNNLVNFEDEQIVVRLRALAQSLDLALNSVTA